MVGRKARSPVGEWLSNQLWNTSLVWIVGLAFAGYGFYLLTNAKLEQHTQDLTQLKTAISDQNKALEIKTRADVVEREKIRNDFVADSKATASGISELNTKTAVMAAQLGTINDTLSKIGDKLDRAASLIKK